MALRTLMAFRTPLAFRTLLARRQASRPARRTGAAVGVVLGFALVAAACGGGGGFNPRVMVLEEFLFVDRGLNPTAPTGTVSLPRNAQLLFIFSGAVDPNTVNQQTIQVRFGPSLQSIPKGSFSVDGNIVRFDPTVTAQGEPNPFGFESVTQYTVRIPNFQDQDAVVRNTSGDPNQTTFFSSFTTGEGYLRELVPPQIQRVFFVPDVHPVTGQVPGNGIMAFEFSEPMDPASFVLGPPEGPDPDETCIDIRYDPNAQINRDAGLVNISTNVGAPIPGFFTHNAAATVYFFHPSFSFGDEEYVFTAEVFQCLRDLSGNLLINPRSFGPFVSDGNGRETGKMLDETFDDTVNMDPIVTDADWGFTEDGILKGQPVTSRNAYIFGYSFVSTDNHWGQYAPVADPLIGAKLNQFFPPPPPYPPTSDGRRVMLAFSDTEMGPDGALTAAGWGADSNATFAAFYPNIKLRAGYQKDAKMDLAGSFAGNYAGTPTVLYDGTYTVQQAQNVGNTPGHPIFTHASTTPYQENPGCATTPPPDWNVPLFSATGFAPWPTFTNLFEWDEGDPLIENDRVMLFDQSVQEGDTWQQIRVWFAVTFPCSGVPIGGFPQRRMVTTYEEDQPNPEPNFGVGILNPEPTVTDSSFTITKRTSFAQSLFYTDGLQPGNSAATTFGDESDYLPVLLTPSAQAGGAKLIIEFQGADAVEFDRRTINQAAAFMPQFSTDIDDADGFKNIRFRIQLVSNLVNNQVARLSMVQIPVVRQD